MREVLDEHGLRGFPKTSGSRGIHVYVRIEPSTSFEEVRRAALALAREVERRMPGRATSRWWKEERAGRVHRLQPERPRPHRRLGLLGAGGRRRARVLPAASGTRSPTSSPRELTPRRPCPRACASAATPRPSIDEHAGRLDGLLELAARDEREGLGDAPWPPHFRKQKGEPQRVQPSRARKDET